MHNDPLGTMQDQLTDLDLKMQQYGRGLADSTGHIDTMKNELKSTNDNMIRFDEQIKGLRKQHKDQNDTQASKLDEMAKSLHALLTAIGVDPTKPETIEATRRDFHEMRTRRIKRENAWDWFTKSLIGAIVGGVLLAGWEGLKVLLHKG